MLTIGSLFSGIGGLELGLERAGLGPVLWQCELDSFCRRVLAKHWPNVTRFEDVSRPRSWPTVDLICGGFPCQDVSSAGARAGLAGARSGLWWMFAAVVAKVAPAWVVVENVAGGVRLWLPSVRRHLCELGYRAHAYLLSAADVGALHLRRRVFVVAHAHDRPEHAVALDAAVGSASSTSPHAARGVELAPGGRASWGGSSSGKVGDSAWCPRGWDSQPEMVRVVHGIPGRLDGARRRALGNSVVPQCAEVIGRLIAASHPISDSKGNG